MIHRIPETGGFTVGGNLTEMGLASAADSLTRFVPDESVSAYPGEWIEIDDELKTCRLCTELNGVRVSLPIPGRWHEATTADRKEDDEQTG